MWGGAQPGAGAGDDPFASIRGNNAEGSLFGGAFWAIAFAVCCACAVVSFFVAYIIWALLTITSSGDVAATPCGAEHNIWLFCLLTVIIMPLSSCVISLIAQLGTLPMLMAIPPVVNLGFFVWGFFMWMAIDTECMMFFETSYWDLTLLFKISVVLLSITFFVLFCMVCLGGAVLAAGATGGGLGGSSEDPEDEKAKALQNACMKGNVEEVERLLAEGASWVVRDRSTGNQALHFAAQAGRKDCCKRLLDAMASVDTPNLTSETPLDLARGHTETEQFLRDFGARADTGAAAASTQEYV
mmetsp:Transcript_48808/g.78647  ORF Transcript_48808/g.78647 Transcript_48808/m.78647 type:complete len:299 (+) Transcript_48808:136-1032(+)|eukprot:CAMPEP_0179434236 /NCGR_PEP_ID=MMETSP0799-20121207/18560_1 /TAXON_ID=46947 /ORGANISM="Geminigera cryophila, Strain CCMP2564" /LENGTH=298 /DNA_ID=CAMNT_0021212833 /DNA_START=136 /DNA_END=1032 /DNA_ORIENTATION=+